MEYALDFETKENVSKAGFAIKLNKKSRLAKMKMQSNWNSWKVKEKKASPKSVAILSSSKREADVLISASQCGSISYLEHKKEHNPNS